jgi:hypothetical protein
MNVDRIYNSIDDEMRRVITWQYDNATKLIGLVLLVKNLYESAIKIPWDMFRNSIFNIEEADTFALSVWGINLGLKRPIYVSGGETIPISDDYFRRILLGRMMLTAYSYSMKDVATFLNIVYGGRIQAHDCNDGTGTTPTFIAFSGASADLSDEEKYLAQNNKDAAFCHAAGVGMSFTLT